VFPDIGGLFPVVRMLRQWTQNEFLYDAFLGCIVVLDRLCPNSSYVDPNKKVYCMA